MCGGLVCVGLFTKGRWYKNTIGERFPGANTSHEPFLPNKTPGSVQHPCDTTLPVWYLSQERSIHTLVKSSDTERILLIHLNARFDGVYRIHGKNGGTACHLSCCARRDLKKEVNTEYKFQVIGKSAPKNE